MVLVVVRVLEQFGPGHKQAKRSNWSQNNKFQLRISHPLGRLVPCFVSCQGMLLLVEAAN